MAKSKLETVDSDQTLINGLRSNFPLKTPFLLAGKTWSVGELVKKLNARSIARTKSASAKASYYSAVAGEDTLEDEVAPLRRGLQRTLEGRYGEQSTKLAEFGFSKVKRTKPSAETTAIAVKQSQATRKARGTVGKKVKKTIKGVAPADGGVTASGGASQPAATTPAQSTPKVTPATTANGSASS